MCSILAILQKEPRMPQDWAALMGRMLALTRQRGPDDSAVMFLEPNVFLGSNRLSIVDLSENGRMPLPDQSGTRWIIFNGELYNYKALRAHLETRGYLFRSTTDTEVILQAYAEWGPDCVKRFNGMFAFVIWDNEQRRLFTARDRFGIKPLYYYEDRAVLILSSDIRPFLLFPDLPRTIDQGALSAFMHLRFIPGTRSIFAGIHKVGLGETILWDMNTGECTRDVIWAPTFTPLDLPEAELTQLLYERLEDAVRHALVGDVPVGVLLSGGLDSSAIVAIMRRLGHERIRTFSCTYNTGPDATTATEAPEAFSFVNPAEDESAYAALVARRFGTHHSLFVIEEASLTAQFEQMIFDLGEPLASTDALGHYLLAQQVGRQVKVVLAGVGSDELLGGYTRMYFKDEADLTRAGGDPLDYLHRFANLDHPRLHMTDYLVPDLVDDEYTHRLVREVLARFPASATHMS